MVTRLSDDEIGLLCVLFGMRQRERETTLWAGIEGELAPAGEWLAQAGLVQRRWCRNCRDLHWRISDAGMEYVVSHNQQIASMN